MVFVIPRDHCNSLSQFLILKNLAFIVIALENKAHTENLSKDLHCLYKFKVPRNTLKNTLLSDPTYLLVASCKPPHSLLPFLTISTRLSCLHVFLTEIYSSTLILLYMGISFWRTFGSIYQNYKYTYSCNQQFHF